MVEPNPKYLDEVRSILFNSLPKHSVRIYLFGSWARGKAQRISDIDVGIWPLQALPPAQLSRLREQFEESHIPYPVEIVDLSTVSPEFRERVLKEGILWNDFENASPSPKKL
ncbi:MAG TPA: nucleotidyltransferase domain-containing protein [Deltaproteobacteria bacterium]|nr:nucleotidyltransferase domain-containing protein [Deltaproteobacteria bacterium]